MTPSEAYKQFKIEQALNRSICDEGPITIGPFIIVVGRFTRPYKQIKVMEKLVVVRPPVPEDSIKPDRVLFIWNITYYRF